MAGSLTETVREMNFWSVKIMSSEKMAEMGLKLGKRVSVGGSRDKSTS